ncbi:MAG: hypothetical protein FJW36_02100 [Acidobacteria bacterium]|nr:hypothetical protein [Acidobacteriota bacterium]
MRKISTPTKDTVRRQQFQDLAAIAPSGAAGVNFRYIACVYREAISDALIDTTLERLAVAPAETVIGFSHFVHGQVSRIAPDATSFPLRQSGGVHIRVSMDWNDTAASQPLMAWADNARQLLRPQANERIYANYQSHVDKGSSKAVFGQSLSKLIALKTKYDPSNALRRNSNVEPLV